MANILTSTALMACPHSPGGVPNVQVNPTHLEASISGGGVPLCDDDVFVVVGCPFTLPGPKPSPCLKVTWSNASPKGELNGAKLLTTDSIGKCINAEEVTQGVVTVSGAQPKASI